MRELTTMIHGGEGERKGGQPVNLPIYQSANYVYAENGTEDDVRYIRLSNTPNHRAIQEKLALLEGGESALVTASGMAAISVSLLALVPPGGEVLAQDSLYGGAHQFFDSIFPTFGRSVRYFSLDRLDEIEAMVSARTSALYVETMSNPLLRVPDFGRIVEIGKRRNLTTIIDNTLASPVNFKPIAHGFDVVVHSASKYLNGHSDLLAGAVVTSASRLANIHPLMHCLGASLDPHACFLLHRGLKTLGIRVEAQNRSAAALAGYLARHPRIERVNYPGLPDHPDRGVVERYLAGAGGVLSFSLAGDEGAADALLRRLRYPAWAPSLGGVESLVVRPATTSHRCLSREELNRAGIPAKLIRVSVGLEDPADLIEDFERALE